MVCGTRCFWFLVFAILNNGNILLDCKKLQRSKRFLIFPRQMPSRFSFIAGIGIPADLEYESLTVGYILRAQFYVPVNETVFRENPFYPEYKSEHNVTYDHHDQHHNYKRNYGLHSRASKLRWNLYTYIAERLNGYGYSGIECVLKAICEASALNFQRYNGVFEQIVHILLRYLLLVLFIYNIYCAHFPKEHMEIMILIYN
uniref:PAB-dependent poly(A)-specific ribonuclease subunit PAN2 n=1 Tax=Zeugodacus cucurbitae TaxID=28588 RepID=A0A0A1X3H5_ZEUCU